MARCLQRSHNRHRLPRLPHKPTVLSREPPPQKHHLDFSPFTITSAPPKRTKIHAFVLYFDTYFATTGDAVPASVPVKVTKEGDVTLAEVWP
jgi:hypothetical protein